MFFSSDKASRELGYAPRPARERIEKINVKILALMLDRKKAQRFGQFAQELVIYEEIDKLEAQIKLIEAE